MAKRTVERDEPPSTKKRPKRDCHFDKAWIQEFQGIGVSSKGVLQPDKAASFSVDTVIGLAKRFPQPDLADSASLDQLREEFIDFTLSPSDLPTPGEYHAADGTIKPRTGIFWSEVDIALDPLGYHAVSADMGVKWSLDTTACETSSLIYVVMPPYLYELKLVEDLMITHGQLMCLLMDGIGAKPAAFDVTVTSRLTPVRPASTKEQQPWLLRLGSMRQ
ncbi:hypothetical protein EMCRGX_G009055 [Ephydatia muelleri]